MNNSLSLLNELINIAKEKRLVFSLTCSGNDTLILKIGENSSYYFYADLVTEEHLVSAIRLISERLGPTQ